MPRPCEIRDSLSAMSGLLAGASRPSGPYLKILAVFVFVLHYESSSPYRSYRSDPGFVMDRTAYFLSPDGHRCPTALHPGSEDSVGKQGPGSPPFLSTTWEAIWRPGWPLYFIGCALIDRRPVTTSCCRSPVGGWPLTPVNCMAWFNSVRPLFDLV